MKTFMLCGSVEDLIISPFLNKKNYDEVPQWFKILGASFTHLATGGVLEHIESPEQSYQGDQ